MQQLVPSWNNIERWAIMENWVSVLNRMILKPAFQTVKPHPESDSVGASYVVLQPFVIISHSHMSQVLPRAFHLTC